MEAQETASAYDFWTACYLLACVCGRGITVNRPRAPVFLNVYIILVADSGITRKSTSIREAIKFTREFGGEYLIENKTTPERLIEQLSAQGVSRQTGNAYIAISELVTFLGRERHTSQMPGLLTDLYDCPSERHGGGGVSSGAKPLRNVFISFLSASTPSWLLRAVNPDVIEGGFTSRVLFIHAEAPKKLMSWPEDSDTTLAANISSKLSGIRDKAREVGKIEISDGGRRAFDKWYRSRTLYRDPFRSSFQSREDAHILRLAAFLAINDNTWTIQHMHIIAAIKVIIEVREDGASIFEGTGSVSRMAMGVDKIRDKLLVAGLSGLPQKELTRAVQNYLNGDQLTAALNIMHDLQMVQKFTNIQVGKGRPVTIWRGTQLLSQSRAIEKIMEKQQPGRF